MSNVTVSAPETGLFYAATPVSYKVTVAKASPEFSFEKATMEGNVGDELEENVLTIGLYDGDVVYTSSDDKVAEVDAVTGEVTMKAPGTVTIKATGAETNNCHAAEATYELKVTLLGDVNGDGQVGIGDIVAITNVMAGIEKDPAIIAAANVNGDGDVGIGDIVAVTNIMAGMK